MSIDPARYVEVSANGSPTDPQAAADLASATAAGALAGDIAGRAAGAEAGAAAGTEVAASAGAAAGAAAGEIAGTAAGTASGSTAGAVAGAAAGGPAGAAAATALLAARTITGGGLATGGGTLDANRVITVTAASQVEAETGTATTVAMTPQRTTQHFNARVSTFMRTVTVAANEAAARATLGAAGLVELAASTGSSLVGFINTGAGAVIRTALAKMGDKISPLDYGAVLNNVADDTAAVQATIAAAAARGACTIDFGGRTAYCGAITIPPSRGLRLKDGGIRVKGDVKWFRGSGGIVTFFTLDNFFIDCSEQTTVGRETIDWSQFAYSCFKRLWFFNNNAGTQINLYAAGDGVVGPYYNTFDQFYGGGGLAVVKIEAAASVVFTVNNNTFRNFRANPGAGGRYGAIIGALNQQNRFVDGVIEDTVGGIGIDDDGDGTFISSVRFEGLDLALNFGANAKGGSDVGSYFDSNLGKRAFFSAAVELLHNSLYGLNGDGSADENRLSGGLRIGGGLRLRGNPGFPVDLLPGQGEVYPSPTLGAVIAGDGSTNAVTMTNGIGAIAARVPAGTQDWGVEGKMRATGGIGVGNSAAATTPGSVTRKVEIFDASGASLGFLAVYGTIT